MLSFFISAVLTSAAFGQVDATTSEEQSAQAEAVAEAIEQLGDRRFSTRQRASKWLWRQGPSVTEALEKATTSDDGEVRRRARQILRDFEYGIAPGVPADLVAHLRAYRDGNAAERKLALERLISEKRFEHLQRLAGMEPDANAQFALLLRLFNSDEAVDYFLSEKRLEKLIESVGDRRDEQWKQTTRYKLLFSQKAVNWLTEHGELERLLAVVETETAADVRRTMLQTLFQNTPSVAALIKKDKLDFLLRVLAKETDAQTRATWLGTFFYSSDAVAHLAKTKKMGVLLEFAEKHIEKDQWMVFFQRIVGNTSAVTALIEEIGFDGLVKLVKSHGDKSQRGDSLGVLMATHAIRQHLTDAKYPLKVVEIAREEKDLEIRGHYLVSLLQRGSYYVLRSEKARSDLWEIVKAAEGQSWRGEVVVRILSTSSSTTMLRDKADVEWILKLADEDMDESQRQQLLERMSYNTALTAIIIKHGGFDRLLELSNKLPDVHRGRVLARLVVSSNAIGHLASNKQLGRVLQLAKDEENLDVRVNYLTTLFQNSSAMQTLIDNGFYEEMLGLARSFEDAGRRALLLVEFAQTPAAVARLKADKEIGMLLEIAGAEQYREVHGQFLRRLYVARYSIDALIDDGHYDALLAMATRQSDESLKTSLLASFYFHDKVLGRLIASKKIATVVDFIADDADVNTRRNSMQRLLQNDKAMAALVAANKIDTLFDIARRETQTYYRGSMLGALISSKHVVHKLIEEKQVAKMFGWIAEEEHDDTQRRMLDTFVGRHDSVVELIEAGFAKEIFAMVQKTAKPDRQGYTFTSLISQESVLTALTKEKQLKLILACGNAMEHQAARRYFVDRLFANYKALELLLENGFFNSLSDLSYSDPEPARRATQRATFLTQTKTIEYLIAKKKTNLLIEAIAEQTDAAAQLAFLQRLVMNETAVSALADQKQLGLLVSLCLSMPDEQMRRQLCNEFLMSPAAIEHLSAGGALDDYVASVGKMANDAERQKFVRRWLGRSSAVSVLIAKGHYDALFKLANEEEDAKQRTALLAQLYANSAVLNRLADSGKMGVVLKFAADELDANQRRALLQQLVVHEKALEIVIDEGQFEKLLELVRGESENYYRGTMLGSLLSNSKVIERVIDRDEVEQLFKWIEADPNPDVLQRILTSLSYRNEVMQKLIDKGHLKRLLKLAGQLSNGYYRGQVTAALLTHSLTVEHLKKNGTLRLLITEGEAMVDDQALYSYLQRLLGNPIAVGHLIDQGEFDSLAKLTKAVSNPQQQASLMGVLLTNSRTVQHLIRENRTGMLIEFVKGQPDTNVRRNCLAQILSNEEAVSIIIEHDQFEALLEICTGESDATQRRYLSSRLLLSARAIEQLDRAGKLKVILADLTDHPINDSDPFGASFFSQLFARSAAVSALIDKGLLDSLIAVIDERLDTNVRRQVFYSLCSNRETVGKLVENGHEKWLFDGIADDPDDNRRRTMLQNVLYQETSLTAFVKSKHAGMLFELLENEPNAASRGMLVGYVLRNAEALEELVGQEHGKRALQKWLNETDASFQQQLLQAIFSNSDTIQVLLKANLATPLVRLLTDDRQTSNRTGYVRRIVSDAAIWRAFIAADEFATLRRLFELETDRRYADWKWQSVLYSPSGLIPYHLARGERETALRLLRENADNDLGRLRLATYFALVGELDNRIAELRAETAKSSDDAKQRELVYLLRAAGNLTDAVEVARSLDDKGLLKALVVEQHRWDEAARLQAADACPLPIPTTYNLSQNETHLQLERLSLVAAYHRLSGDDAASQQALDELQTIVDANPDDVTASWLGVEGMLLNDRVQDGLRQLAKTHPDRAFDLHTMRLDYAQALNLVNWTDGRRPDREWVTSLPIGPGGDSMRGVLQVEMALKVARTLHSLGDTESAMMIVDVADELAEEQELNNSSSAPRRRCWESIAVALLAWGHEQRAMETAAKALFSPNTTAPTMLQKIFPGRYEQARGWFIYLRHLRPAEMPAATFIRIRRILEPPADEDPAELADLVAGLRDHARTLTGITKKMLLTAAGHAYQSRGQLDDAVDCFGKIAETDAEFASLAGDMCRRQENWGEAAQFYHKAWTLDPEQLAALYLSGDALVRAGQQEEGQRRQQLASQMAIESRARQQIAAELAKHHLDEEAHEQYELLLRVAPPEHWEWNEAVRKIADKLSAEDPAASIPYLEASVLDDLRVNFYLLKTTSYLGNPASFHRIRAKAEIAAGRFDEAVSEAELAIAATPAKTEISEELVPLLTAAGATEQADKIFEKQFGFFEDAVKRYPASPLLNNNLAWLAARCNRRLDTALKHAEQANTLSPDNAGFLDTLAEVKFRLGDREAAIRHSRRALELRPNDAALKQQLQRFESETPPQ